MLYGMHLSAGGALVEEARQAVIANNLANVSTTGFKADTAVFRQRLIEAQENPNPSSPASAQDGLTGGVFLDEVRYNSSGGALVPTKQSLDLALRGDGFFAVTDGKNTFYTRAGNFVRNPAGELVTADGRFKALGTDGRPIRLAPGEVTVNQQGEIRVAGRIAGRLLIQGSLDPDRFEKVGENLFRYLGSGPPPAAKAVVLQGVLEESNVKPVTEMVRLVQSHRAYEANLQMAKIQDGTLGRAVAELARVVA